MMKDSMKWAVQTLQELSASEHTGTVTIRLSQGGVQSIQVSQELQPRDMARRFLDRAEQK